MGTQVMSESSASNHPRVNTPAASSSGKKATQLGDFILRKKIGQGGMGAVYLGYQVSLDRPCAVKVLSKALAEKPGFKERFLREARAMAKIEHPNVVACYAVGEDHGHNYVAMELIDGQSGQDWLDRLGRFTIPDALLITITIAEALEHAHKLKMVHRDVKPDNILITKKGVIKVSDLGLAKATDEDMSMTQSGTGLGTPHYMPPEQARNAKYVDQRCDIYALGCTLYHMVTGSLPFSGETIVELITNKEQGKFKSAKRRNAEIPDRLDLIIDKMMAKDPKHRYASMQEVVDDLDKLNMTASSLSFIDHPEKVVVRRGSTPSMPTMSGSSGAGATLATKLPPRPAGVPKTSAEDAESRRLGVADPQKTWYVKRVDSSGKIKIGKMTTVQILAGIKGDKLGPQAQAAIAAKGPFLPLAQIPVFEDEAKKMLTRNQAKMRGTNLAAEYEKISREYERQKWWRLLARWRDGTLSFVGFLLYLAVIAAVIGGLIWLIPQAWEYIAHQLNLT